MSCFLAGAMLAIREHRIVVCLYMVWPNFRCREAAWISCQLTWLDPERACLVACVNNLLWETQVDSPELPRQALLSQAKPKRGKVLWEPSSPIWMSAVAWDAKAARWVWLRKNENEMLPPSEFLICLTFFFCQVWLTHSNFLGSKV
jgi:hypothetical protein